jgi:hypothetical protein
MQKMARCIMTQKNTLQRRARFYAHILSILFQSQNLAGGRLATASRGARHLSLGIKLSDPTELDKALKLAESLALASNTEAVLSQRQLGLIIYQFQLAQGFWQSYTRADLPSNKAVGLAEKRQPVEFDLSPLPHSLIAGTTGSGKTETVKSILLSLMAQYSPNELSLVVCDAHGDLPEFENVAHLALPLATTQEEMRQALLFVNQELANRKAENIRDAKIVVLAIDEATETLETEASQAIVKMICREGRKFGIHIILGTQKPSHKDLPGILDLLNNRFVGLVADGKLSANLTGHAGLQAHKLTGQGDFIHIAGLDIKRFQVAQATRQDFERLERAEGRPKLEVLPHVASWYHFFDNKISIGQARERGISRDSHSLHKGFVSQFMATTQALLEGETS